MQLSEDKKLQLLYRVEPGCLGPNGRQYIEGFCQFAQQSIVAPFYASYQFAPRFDKQLPERQYKVNGRNLSAAQAGVYLNHFDMSQSDFEEQLDELLTQAIDTYLKR